MVNYSGGQRALAKATSTVATRDHDERDQQESQRNRVARPVEVGKQIVKVAIRFDFHASGPWSSVDTQEADSSRRIRRQRERLVRTLESRLIARAGLHSP